MRNHPTQQQTSAASGGSIDGFNPGLTADVLGPKESTSNNKSSSFMAKKGGGEGHLTKTSLSPFEVQQQVAVKLGASQPLPPPGR
jgi:hypothetical protein